MASVSMTIVAGNLGQDPLVRFLPTGKMTVLLSVATTDRWTDKVSGELKELTEWHRVVYYGRQAELAKEFLKKGSGVYVRGKNRTRQWTDKDGIARWTTEIVGNEFQMLDKKAKDIQQPDMDEFKEGNAGKYLEQGIPVEELPDLN